MHLLKLIKKIVVIYRPLSWQDLISHKNIKYKSCR